VAAVRNRANKAVAARSTLGPSWYDAGESAELARVLSELLDVARRQARDRALRDPAGSRGEPGRSTLTLLVRPDLPAGQSTDREPDRHCLPTWDEVAADVAELYRTVAGMPAATTGPREVVGGYSTG